MDQLPERDVWAFEALKELLMREKGFDLEAYKQRCILRRIYLKVRSRGHGDLGQFYRELSRNPEELEKLFQYLTIHVTEFFRNPTAFMFLERRVLPRLLAEHGAGEPFNIWSVGCSSGEEPYSLAILLMRARQVLGIKGPFSVLATDVDGRVLERGKSGRYRAEALKNLRPQDLEEYFRPDDGGYIVSDEVRRHVIFSQKNVLTDQPDEVQDIVVCRNLLIYLSRENQERVITMFSQVMRPGGCLMLGKAETLIGRNRQYFQSVSPSERIYRKREVMLED